MSEEERRRREDLSVALQRRGLLSAYDSHWWPQWKWLRSYGSWDPIVPELAKECEAGGGPITEFYVNGLLDIARCAIPAINEIETVNRASNRE